MGLAGGFLARGARAQTPSRGGTLTVGLTNDAKTYDPIFSVEFTERYVLYLAFDTLVRYGPDFSIQPELAEKWETSPDGKRIVFTLRDGVKFQDGTAFDAAAVKWNIDQRMDEKVKSPQRQLLTPIIDLVEVVDPRHVAFNLKAPSPPCSACWENGRASWCRRRRGSSAAPGLPRPRSAPGRSC